MNQENHVNMSQFPTLVLIGRPNVGKSTLFNRLTSQLGEGSERFKRSIVGDRPGLTRDRQFAQLEIRHEETLYPFFLVDTAGFFTVKCSTDFFDLQAEEGKLAMDTGDLFLVVCERGKLHPYDQEIIQYLRQQKKRVALVVNKCDGSEEDYDFYSLGIDPQDICFISALHGRGQRELDVLIGRLLSECEKGSGFLLPRGYEQAQKAELKLAILGTPNVGKSTLLNRLVGEDRALVADQAGTTVDPVEGSFTVDKRRQLWAKVVDTAGVRRKRSIDDALEKVSVKRSIQMIDQAEIVLVVLDGTNGVCQQDQRLVRLALDRGKSIILVLNKWDELVKGTNEKERKNWLTGLRRRLDWIPYCDIVPISAKTGENILALRKVIEKTWQVRSKQIPTGRLNRFLQEAIDHRPILVDRKRGTFLKLKYAHMIRSAPPTFVLFVNRELGITDNFRRYLENALRREFMLINTPVRIAFTKGRKKEELMEGEEQGELV